MKKFLQWTNFVIVLKDNSILINTLIKNELASFWNYKIISFLNKNWTG